MENYDLIVVGGGPAGFFAAITAAESNKRLNILILEKNNDVLSKVRISGGGRCNLTHACFDPTELVEYYPRGNKELRGPFSRFQPADTVTWFEDRGVPLKTEEDGRMFPQSNRSESIVDCLIEQAKIAGVKIQTKIAVKTIQKIDDRFEIKLSDGTSLETRKIIMASGGASESAYRMAKDIGHKIVPPVPSLFSFNIHDSRIDGLAGVSVANVELFISRKGKAASNKSSMVNTSGPLLITHWGMSGPAVLKLSAWGAREFAESNYQKKLIVNWLPEFDSERLYEKILGIKKNNPRQLVATHPIDGKLPSRLWKRLVTSAGIAPEQAWNEISNLMLKNLAIEVCKGEFQIQGKGVFKEEFVTCGGVELKAINFKTMESRMCPGLYFAGEILDIDGLTGGFNFQSAWTTGWLAGRAIAKNPLAEQY